MSELDVSEFADGERGVEEPTKEVDGGMAPTVSIEEVGIVRPIKVVALLSMIIGVILLSLAIAASGWIRGDNKAEGLWAVCYDDVNETGVINCMDNESRIGSLDWMDACRAMSIVALMGGFAGFIVGTIGVTSSELKMKPCFYTTAIVLMFLSSLPILITLITFAKRFVEENQPETWSVGWPYVLSIITLTLYLASAVIFIVDKNADEIVLCEVSSANEENGIEEATDV
ncbi:peripheral myelin protein 22-like [Argopecten irradians]|uniref:peripheral myelin protein 22-like n=1 Tax=Argopecten irradians TaxID=31199 RepID=UPI003711D0E5